MNLKCRRCGEDTPRLTVEQVHCPRCLREVAQILEADERRRVVRFPARDFTHRLAS